MRDFLGEEGKRTQGTTEEHRVTATEGTGSSSFTRTVVANDGSQSNLEAKEVFLSEKRAAEDTIQRQDVPAGYQRFLRKYFDAIEPDTGEDR